MFELLNEGSAHAIKWRLYEIEPTIQLQIGAHIEGHEVRATVFRENTDWSLLTGLAAGALVEVSEVSYAHEGQKIQIEDWGHDLKSTIDHLPFPSEISLGHNGERILIASNFPIEVGVVAGDWRRAGKLLSRLGEHGLGAVLPAIAGDLVRV